MTGHSQSSITQKLGAPPLMTFPLQLYCIQLKDRGHVFVATGGSVLSQLQAQRGYSRSCFIKTLIISPSHSINFLANTIYNTDGVRKRSAHLNSKMKRRKAGTYGRAIEIGRKCRDILVLVASVTCVGKSTNGQITSLAIKRESIPRLRGRRTMPLAAGMLHWSKY